MCLKMVLEDIPNFQFEYKTVKYAWLANLAEPEHEVREVPAWGWVHSAQTLYFCTKSLNNRFQTVYICRWVFLTIQKKNWPNCL